MSSKTQRNHSIKQKNASQKSASQKSASQKNASQKNASQKNVSANSGTPPPDQPLGQFRRISIPLLREQGIFSEKEAAPWCSTSSLGIPIAFAAAYLPAGENARPESRSGAEGKLVFTATSVDKAGKPFSWTSIITLSRLVLHRKGSPFVFLCPGRVEEPCNQRVAHLYIVGSHLLCRHCCKLKFAKEQHEKEQQELYGPSKIFSGRSRTGFLSAGSLRRSAGTSRRPSTELFQIYQSWLKNSAPPDVDPSVKVESDTNVSIPESKDTLPAEE